MDHEIIKIETRRIFKVGYWVLIILGIFLAFEALNAFKTLRAPEYGANTISVVGKGESVTVPDVATFTFTVSAEAKNVSDAQANVTKKMDSILPDLKALGIDDKDIKTTDYSIYPKFTYETVPCGNGICTPAKQVTDGYTVNHSILVKVRKTDDAGKALSSVGGKGATNVSGLTFTTDDPDKAINDARTEAIDDARAKAEDLAKHLGVKLVRVVGYFDEPGNPGPIYSRTSDAGYAKSSVESAPTLPVGENKTTVSVTVNYEIR